MHEMGRRCGGIWKVGVDNLTMHTHFAHDMFLYLPFYDYLNYVLNSILFMVSTCKYSFEHVLYILVW